MLSSTDDSDSLLRQDAKPLSLKRVVSFKSPVYRGLQKRLLVKCVLVTLKGNAYYIDSMDTIKPSETHTLHMIR